MDGIVIVDKPAGMTSAAVVAAVKRLLRVKKVGHTGTLDPIATGVLVCCVGQATRLARFFLHGTKQYEAVMRLGIETDTQDATGAVTAETACGHLGRGDVEQAARQFTGEIEQTPPVYSALKHQGVPLYKLARRGTPVEKPPRRVTVHELAVTGFDPPDVRLETSCSGGTYVRTLCADIGRVLGCGAHMAALRRTGTNGFSDTEAHTLDELSALAEAGRAAEALVPMAEALRGMACHEAEPALVRSIRHGAALTWNDLGYRRPAGPGAGRPDHLKVVDAGGALVAVLESREDGTGLDYCCVFASAPQSGGQGAATGPVAG